MSFYGDTLGAKVHIMNTDATMAEVMDAIGVLQRGDRVEARRLLLNLWGRCGSSDDSSLRCTVAHFLADAEEDLESELKWDLRALEAATGQPPGGDNDAVTPDLAAFLPSLHLNAGDTYRRLGRDTEARLHAQIGMQRAHVLPDDGYGGAVKTALGRLLFRLTG